MNNESSMVLPILKDRNDLIEYRRKSLGIILQRSYHIYKYLSQIDSDTDLREIDVSEIPKNPGPIPDESTKDWNTKYTIWRHKSDDYKTFHNASKAVVGAIVVSVQGEAYQRMMKHSDYVDAIETFNFMKLWKLVLSVFKSNGYMKCKDKIDSLRSLLNMKMADTEDIHIYIDRFEHELEFAEHMDNNIDDNDAAIIFIDSLSTNYNGLRDTIKANNKIMSLQQVKDISRGYNTNTIAMSTANVFVKGNKRNPPTKTNGIIHHRSISKEKDQKICYRCQKKGHFAFECNAPNPVGRDNENKSKSNDENKAN